MVYFVGQGGCIKIGFAADVKSRMISLQIGNPEKLELVGSLPGDAQTESNVHKIFDHLHVRGEWFRDDGEIRKWLTSVSAYVKASEYDLKLKHIEEARLIAESYKCRHCPKCSATMKRRRRISDGQGFWGCSNYPQCRGALPLEGHRKRG